jgi:hypothetical protein
MKKVLELGRIKTHNKQANQDTPKSGAPAMAGVMRKKNNE